MVRVSGAFGGGKGGGQPAPTEYPNTLRQEQKISLLYIIGEGECQGFPPGDPREHIYLDNVPVLNKAGVANYQLDAETRLGSPNQSVIPGFNEITQPRAPGVQLRASLPLEQQITDADADAFEVAVRVPTLQLVGDDNSISGSTVAWRISLSSDGGPYVILHDAIATEKSNGPFVRTTRHALTGPAPWTVRLERLTPDSTSVKLQNETFWESLTEVNYGTGSFNGVALFAVRNVDAREFSSLPEITIDWMGRKVPIPANYDGTSRVYSGAFNGTLKTEWTDNPAWILSDILSDPIAGCGLPPIDLDVYEYYELSQWADAQNPKLSFNANITTQADAIELLASVASRLFTILMRRGSEVVPIIDDVRSTIRAVFGDANTVQSADGDEISSGNFSITTTKLGQRPAIAFVTYSDPANFFEPIVERVVYEPAVAWHSLRGLRPPEVDLTAFGCSSRSEARQFGLYTLVTNFHQFKSVQLETGPEGARVAPGDNITVYDNVRQLDTKKGSGRLVAATRTTLTLDAPYTFDAGKAYKVQLYNPETNTVAEVAIANPAISTAVLSAVPTLTFDPLVGSLYAVSTATLEPEIYRVLEAKESDSEQLTYAINALKQMPDKWAVINSGAIAVPRDNVDLPNAFAVPPMPANFEWFVSPSAGYRSNGYLQKLDLIWHVNDGVGNVREFSLEFKDQSEPDSAWKPLAITSGAFYTYPEIKPGRYSFRVQSISLIGKRSPFANITVEILNSPPRPANVAGLGYSIEDDQISLTWQPVADIDVVNAGNYLIKYLPPTGGGFDFNSGVYVGGDIPGNAGRITLPAKAGVYQIVARNSEGLISAIASSVTVPIEAVPGGRNVIFSRVESEELGGFDGFKSNMVLTGTGDLKLAFTAAGAPNVRAAGTYSTGDNAVFIGSLQPVILDLTRVTQTIDESSLWDDSPGLFAATDELVSGGLVQGANTYVEIQESIDGTIFNPWRRLTSERVSLVVAAFRLRLVAESMAPTINTVTEYFRYQVEAPGAALVPLPPTIVGWRQFTFASPYDVAPEVRIYFIFTGADKAFIQNVTATGFEYAVKNQSDQFVANRTTKFNLR